MRVDLVVAWRLGEGVVIISISNRLFPVSREVRVDLRSHALQKS
jgi:hypothetical protein